jgi:hypothetical protein
MPVYKGIGPKDIKTAKSFLNQLVDVVQESVSGSATRKAYEVFISGSGAASITSSLFQTVFDQDFTLATANEMFDITVGLFASSTLVTGAPGYGVDTAGKLTFDSNTAMMREKVQVYSQFAQILLGNANAQFTSPFTNAGTDDKIDAAVFIPFKRLFSRDGIKHETFAMKIFASAALDGSVNASAYEKSIANTLTASNIDYPAASGSFIVTDAGAGSTPQFTYGGTVSNLINASNTSQNVGLIFYDQGIAVLDMEKVFFSSQHMSGVISAATASDTFGGVTTQAGTTFIGRNVWSAVENPSASFIPDFVVSSSMDDIINHLASVRFGNSSNSNDTAITFQNLTAINSTLVFCEASADEFNYSSNPTFTDSDGRIVVIDQGEETTQKSFTFITTIGLYDAADNLLAVAKLSRPVEKNDEKKLSFRVRLDY